MQSHRPNFRLGMCCSHTRHCSQILVYKDGSKKINVKNDVPIVSIVGGEAADVKPGLPVFIVAVPKESGDFTASRIVAGKDGVAPPM